MKRKLLKVAKKLSISDSVFINSGMSFEDLAQHFRSADLVIYPSYYEGQGLIPLESMSSGTPIVIVDMPPLTEMVDTSVGRLFEMGNSIDLAKQSMTFLMIQAREYLWQTKAENWFYQNILMSKTPVIS